MADVSEIVAAHGTRIAGCDPAVAVKELPVDGRLSWPGVVGVATVSDSDPSLQVATWGTLRQHILAMRWDGTPGALAAAINDWLGSHHDALREPEVSLSISWPARDVAATAEFLQTPLSPLTTVALRRTPAQQIAAPAAEMLRRAVPADLDGILALQMAEVRYDEQLSNVTLRPSTEPGSRAEFETALAAPDPWIWVAARGEELLGVISLQRPEAALWITTSTTIAPAAYLGLGSVAETHRGAGVGYALASAALTHLDQAGVAGCLLHFSTLNPLSSPFWARLGFRPLTQTWSTFSP